MLKLIRKTTRQKVSNVSKDLEDNDKPGIQNQSISPEITVLINQRDLLQEETKNLKDQLKNGTIRYEELKSLKSQQVCALTFKLAKAIRDVERLVEKNERLTEELQDTRQGIELQNALRCKIDEQTTEVVHEFHRIQQELCDVKRSMSMVQTLNERLSRDLQLLTQANNSQHALATSARMRKNGLSSSPEDCVEQAEVFVFPIVESVEENHIVEEPALDLGDELGTNGHDQNCFDSSKPRESGFQKVPIENSNDTHDDEQTSSEDGDTKRDSNEMDFRKQLDKAMKELDDLRADNKQMKHQMNKMASSSTNDDDFLRRTANFTSQMLQKMREREQKVQEKKPVNCDVPHPPLSILGTSLDKTTKVDDMAKHPVITPEESSFVTAPSGPQPALATPMTPCKPDLPSEIKPISKAAATDHKQRRFTIGKLGEPALQFRRGCLSTEVSLRKPMESLLAKEWKSSETLNPQSSFSSSLGYKDYIHRHIVMSSNAIAKIRDLTAEELYAGQTD